MDLKKILDPKARFIFFSQNLISYVCPIVHVDQNFLYFSSQKPLPDTFDEGHFLALDGAGIVQLTKPSIEALKEKIQKNLDSYLYRYDFDSSDYAISNRRQSVRFEFDNFIPISFKVFGENMTAQIINISEGGLRMRSDTPLKHNIICQLEIKIPTKDGIIKLKTNGVVMYADKEDGGKEVMIGMSFATPEFANKDEEKDYFNAKEELRKFISQKEHTI